MKLKDIFPRYLLREKSYGELELGGSEGTAFAHLTEDAGSVVSDWVLVSGDPNGVRIALAPSGYVETVIADENAASAYAAWVLYAESDDDNRFFIAGDGSLHWGDGSAAPDTELKRGSTQKALVVRSSDADDDFDGTLLLVPGHATGVTTPGLWFYLQPGDMGGGDDTDHLIEVWPDAGNGNQPTFVLASDGSLHWGDGSAAPDTWLRRDDVNGAALVSRGFIASVQDAGDPYASSYAALDGAGTLYLAGSASVDFGDVSLTRSNAGQLKTLGSLWITDADNTTETDIGASFVGFFRAAEADAAFHVGLLGGDADKLTVLADGSLHWGNGTDAPDVSMKRSVNGDVQFNSGGYVIAAGADSYGFAASLDGSTFGGDFSTLNPDGSIDLRQSGHLAHNTPAQVQLFSPNGTAYNVTVTNDGTLDVAAA